jgi:hypothetical protein
MTATELIQQIKSAGLYPIQVEGNAERDKSSDLSFVGSLEQFFEAAKILESKAVFFFVGKLDEEDFLHDSEYDEEDFDEEGVDSGKSAKNGVNFDLTVALPSLADFKKHLGKECAFSLTAKSQLSSLSFYLAESWWDSFVEQREKAIQKFDENREAMREKTEEQQQQKEDGLLQQVRGLLSDSEFCRIPTQRGMKAYALEKFPGLKEVDESRLVEEIRKLDDKVKARKRK